MTTFTATLTTLLNRSLNVVPMGAAYVTTPA
jgi:hypothetical protein